MSVYTVTTTKSIQGVTSGSTTSESLTLNKYNTTYYGLDAGYNNAGMENTFLGYQTGYNTLTGGYNLFAGYNAGYSNTYGNRNVFMGDGGGVTILGGLTIRL